MRVTGTVMVQNRAALQFGFGPNSKLARACKGVIQVRSKANGSDIILVSTRKDLAAYEYDVKTIQNLRTQFVSEGLATIEISDPPMNVMIRDCKPNELKEFIDSIVGLRRSPKLQKDQSTQADGAEALDKSTPTEVPGSLRKSRSTAKRTRSPELSKIEASKLRKNLMKNQRQLTIKTRKQYPTEFNPILEEMRIFDIGLRKIDARWLAMSNLVTIEVRQNILKNVDALRKLSCPLQTLILASNQIEALDDGFFSNPSLCSLAHLDLSGNRLARLPNSIDELRELTYANFSSNKLVFLPHNWMTLVKLRHLNLSRNRLHFLPESITRLQLTRLDMSNNFVSSRVNEGVVKYFGFNEFPTLFEMSCEKTMNLLWRSRRRAPADLPDIILQYLKAGKYCFCCGKFTLRYMTMQRSLPPSLFCSGIMSTCLVSPAEPCMIKSIRCYQCERTPAPIRLARVRVPFPYREYP